MKCLAINLNMNKAVIFFLIAATGCTSKKSPTTATAVDSVEVFSLKKEPVTKTLSLPAELLPWERTELFAKVEGYVKELKVDIGSRIMKNDILVIIDAPEVMANAANHRQICRPRIQGIIPAWISINEWSMPLKKKGQYQTASWNESEIKCLVTALRTKQQSPEQVLMLK